MQQNFDQVIEILKKEGLSDEQISQFVVNLTKALSEQLYLSLVEQMSEEDMARLNTIDDDTQREQEMRQLFEQKTGQNLQQISDSFVKSFTQEFLAGYHELNPSSTVS